MVDIRLCLDLDGRLYASPHFWRKNLISFGTFPYALSNLTFTNKLLVKGQNKKKIVSLKKFFVPHFCQKKCTTKTVDQDPVACQRWISRKEI